MRYLVLLCLLATPVWAQDKDVITTGSKSFPEGTTVNPKFVVPADNAGSYLVKIPCDPTLNIIIQIEDDAGKLLGRFTRIPGPCITPNGDPIPYIIGKWVRRDSQGQPVPIEKSTNIQTRVTNQAKASTTKEIIVEFDK